MLVLYYTVLIRWERMAAAGERRGGVVEGGARGGGGEKGREVGREMGARGELEMGRGGSKESQSSVVGITAADIMLKC